jgi:hypothetical protein
MTDPTPNRHRSPLEHERDARNCPLGDDCDLTLAWMKGQQEARDSFRARIEELKTQVGLARIDADQQRARAEAAEAQMASGSFYQEKDIDALMARADLPPTLAEVVAHPKVAALVAAAGVMFDASRDPGCSPGEWERATLSLGAALAALKGGDP